MNAFELVESELEGLEAATKPLTVRFVRALLERVSFKMDREAHKAAVINSKLALELEVLTELATSDRIVNVDEARQVRVVNNDHNLVGHPQYDEHEQLDL